MATSINFPTYGFINDTLALNEENWRKFFKPFIYDSVQSGLVTTKGTGMTVDISAGECRCGAVMGLLNSSITLDVSNGHSTYDRIDSVMVQYSYSDPSTLSIAIKQGTPSANPVAPEMSKVFSSLWQMEIAQILVPSGATSSSSLTITDKRVIYESIEDAIDDIVISSSTEPTSPMNEIWFQDEPDNEYTVPTNAEFTELEQDVTDLKNSTDELKSQLRGNIAPTSYFTSNSEITIEGITFTINADKSITMNGTATGVNNNGAYFNLIQTTQNIKLKPGIYVFSGQKSEDKNLYSVAITIAGTVYTLGGVVSKVITVTEESTYRLNLFVPKGKVLNNITYYPEVYYIDTSNFNYIPSKYNIENSYNNSYINNYLNFYDDGYTLLGDIDKNSVYQINSNWTIADIPPMLYSNGCVVITNIFTQDKNYRTQLIISYSAGEIFHRRYQNSTWGEWSRQTVINNILNLNNTNNLNNLSAGTLGKVSSDNIPSNYPSLFGTKAGLIITLPANDIEPNSYLYQIAIKYDTGMILYRKKDNENWSSWFSDSLQLTGSLASNSDANDRKSFTLDGIAGGTTISNWPHASSKPGSLLTIPLYGSSNIFNQYSLPYYTEPIPNLILSQRKELGVYSRRYQNSVWTDWNFFKMIPRNYQGKYYAFGDSTSWGYSSDHDHARSPWNYPFMVGDLIGVDVHNLSDPAQGLIKDWSVGTTGNFAIIPTIEQMISDGDFENTVLITVGWAYNDASYYSSLNFGNPTDPVPSSTTGITTYLGYYAKILDILQAAAPLATVILITGFGSTSNTEGHKADNQFTATNTFADGTKTVKERYDAMEEMANYNGYFCINQAKGTVINKINANTIIGDNIHPTYDNYRIYGNFLASRIASIYQNI